MNTTSFELLEMMIQYIYCGNVDIELGQVENFRLLLDFLKVEYDQSEDGESYNYDDFDDEPELIEPEPQEIIDLEEPEWSDSKANIKKESNEHDEYVAESLDVSALNDEEINFNSTEPSEEVDPPVLKPSLLLRKLQNYRKFHGGGPYRLMKQSPTNGGKISVERVVPSLEIQRIMANHPDICPFCNKKFKTMKHRNEHVKYCLDNPNRIVSKCSLCRKSVCDPYYLRKHMKNVHGNAGTSS